MTTDEFEYVCRFVRERSSIVLEAGKEYLVDTRLTPVARQYKLGSVGELIAKHQLVAPPRARAIAAATPAPLDDLIDEMLAKEPGRRPQSMDAVPT